MNSDLTVYQQQTVLDTVIQTEDVVNPVSMEMGISLFIQCNYEEAIKIFSVLADNGNEDAVEYLARCYYRLYDFQQSYKYYQILSNCTGKSRRNYSLTMLATIEMMWGNYSYAIRVLKSLPENPLRSINLALTYWKKYTTYKDHNSLADAIFTIERINLHTIIKSDLQKIFHLRALIFQAEKNFSSAKVFYQKALVIGGLTRDVCPIMNDLASLHLELGQLEKAEQYLLQSRESSNNNEFLGAQTDKWFGVLAILQNKNDEAKTYINRAIQVFQNRELMGDLVSISYISDYTGNLALAQSSQPLVILNGNDPRFKIGIHYYSEGNFLKAIELFSQLASQGSLEARKYLANCYYQMDLLDSAHEHFLYLAEHGGKADTEFGVSMAAAMELMQGKIGPAMKRLKSVPESPRHLVNLSIAYFKAYSVQKDEFSIREALRLLKKINQNHLSTAQKQKLFNLMALIHQAQQEYHLAKRYYTQALELSETPEAQASVLNDYASLLIEQGDFVEAGVTLAQARELVSNIDSYVEALNNKWYGILASVQKHYLEAKVYFENAAKVIRDKELFQELASILYILADSTRKENFYQAAEYFADGLSYERMSEEISERDDTMIRFYYDGFFCK